MTRMQHKAVFLDRDGVLNRAPVRDGKPYPPRSLAELEILPGVSSALASLKAAGYQLVVVTNQPDVARGLATEADVDALNRQLRQVLPLDAVFTCLHDDAAACGCRKPQPGLIHEAARQLGIDCRASFLVGDRWRDIEAGRRAGCCTFFIDYAYQERLPQSCDFIVSSLLEASGTILELQGVSAGHAKSAC